MSEKTRILIVDDEPLQLRVLVDNFEGMQTYEVLTASNGDDALTMTLEHHPALIISDFYMPGMDGLQLCKMVKMNSALRGTLFVMLTSAGSISAKIAGLNNGADDYVAKPVEFEELLSKVGALLRIKALQDELSEDKRELEKLNRELQEDFHGILSLLMKVLALRVPNAMARIEQSSTLCAWIAERLGMDENQRRTLLLADSLREIGKVNLPDGLLSKTPLQFSESERDQYQQYPVLGHLMLIDIPQLKDVALLVRHQYEHFDGSGYPDRLTGSQIPAESRILRSINLVEELLEKHNNSLTVVREKLMDAGRTILDPKCAMLVEEYLRVAADPSWLIGKRAVHLDQLAEGMVIAGNIVSGRGLMLLAKDSTLTKSQIQHLRSLNHFDPIIHAIYVYNEATI